MLIIVYVLLLASIGLVVLALIHEQGQRSRRIRLAEDVQPVSRSIQARALLRNMLPFTRNLLERLNLEGKIKNRLAAAHSTMSPQEFINLKIILLIVVVAAAFFLLPKVDPLILAGAALIAFFIPNFMLKKMIAKRKDAIGRLLPETVDLLGLCVEAGLDFTTACKWIIEKVPTNPLIEELAFVLEEIKWGKSRTQALRDMSRRLNVPEVSSFVQTLVQSERMGTPVAEAFAILSEDTRLQRFHRGERIAMAAPIKILIPLIFCILPVIGIVIGGPIFLQFMEGNLLKGLAK
ncbi:MAG TPA: type II secretion system F family protein [Candidatus Omnitrophota bacterium]|nr:type II secretion system F family protein [Candidatus Omnitrophota bacterium]